jgi:hypothetical protein
VLGLGLGRFESTSQNTDLSIVNLFGHLRMGDILVDENAVDEACIFN